MIDVTERTSMQTFFVVWAGQLVSLVGTNLTGFALAVFVYLETGSATQLSLVLLAAQVPQLLITPVAGALVDRWDRRWAMLLSDGGAGVATLAIAALLFTDRLEIWHLYPLLGMASLFQAFQWPAYTAATTLLGKGASSEDVAEVLVLYALGARAVTGQLITIDNGTTINIGQPLKTVHE